MKLKRAGAFVLTTALLAGMITPFPVQAKTTDLPASFDLRDLGMVTPVKDQDPFGTCWAFGSISSLETAVLKELGMTYEEAAAAGGEIAKLTDLSEKHLAWFTYQGLPASVDPTQAGEGMIIKNLELNPVEIYDKGGFSIYASALLANCGGPATEEAIPYEGKKGIRIWEYLEENKQEVIESYIESGYSPEEAEEEYRKELENAKRSNAPSPEDDWTLSGDYWKTDSPITIENANFLPSTILKDVKLNYAGLNSRAVDIVKQELFNGNSVTMSYAHSGEFLNESNWAYYFPDLSWSNHRVCIVGWDDNYKKENFGILGDDGNIISDSIPEGDGAWIVKNSWGHYHEYDPEKENEGLMPTQWGVDDSGYFYLSYYDRSIEGLETVDISLDLEGTEKETVHQYDYCVLDSYDGSSSPSEVSTANVFKTKGNERIKALATRSHAENSSIKMEVYLLNEDPTDPRDGQLLTTVEENFRYKGYHRVNLDQDVYVPANRSYSVVVTEMVTYNDDSVSYVKGEDVAVCPTEKGLKSLPDLLEYKKVIVNPGESFSYENGIWTDLSENYQYELTADSLNQIFDRNVDEEFAHKVFGMSLSNVKKKNVMCADNYCIKSFTVEAPEYEPQPEDPSEVMEGRTYTVGTGADMASYQVLSTSNRTVKYRQSKSEAAGSNVVIPSTVILGDNQEYAVVGISQDAFAQTPKVKKLILKTPFLEKDHTNGCLHSSKIKTVVVQVGNKVDNKEFRKYYSPIFTKKHCGKKVKIK